jgi:hypothetical protein
VENLQENDETDEKHRKNSSSSNPVKNLSQQLL